MYDTYGGWLELKAKKTGFFHTEQIQGRWWLVSPEGNAFFSKGVDHVNFAPESDSAPKVPDDPAAWAKAAEQLRGWNFNTLGAWSSPQMYSNGLAYAPMVDVAASGGRNVWLKGGIVDYFSSQFQEAAARAAQRICVPHVKDPWLLGYFTDTELRWGSDWRGTNSVLEEYLKMPATAAGSQKAITFLTARGHSPDNLSAEDKREFLGLVGGEYAHVASEAIRRADPNHLVLGCRFAVYPGDDVIHAVGQYFDVISYHSYNQKPPVDRLELITQIPGHASIAAAARVLYVGHAGALAQMLHKIETAAGFAIIDRSSAPLAPTTAGREFISEASQILRIAQEQGDRPDCPPADSPNRHRISFPLRPSSRRIAARVNDAGTSSQKRRPRSDLVELQNHAAEGRVADQVRRGVPCGALADLGLERGL